MLGDTEEVAVRVRAAGLCVEPAKVCYPFTLLRRELSNHRATFKKFKPFKSFKTIPGWSGGLNDWNVLNDLNPLQRMLQPLITPTGRKRATRLEMPAMSIVSTTSATSL